LGGARRGYVQRVANVTQLRGTEDYAVETPAGEIGRVEEVRAGALAVRTRDGTRALLRGNDVLTVDREHHWVVVDEHPTLVELASGGTIHPEPIDRLAVVRAAFQRHLPHLADRPLWQLVAILYGALTFIVGAGVGLVFLIAWLTAGAPY
jgi:hypothetical protein